MNIINCPGLPPLDAVILEYIPFMYLMQIEYNAFFLKAEQTVENWETRANLTQKFSSLAVVSHAS